MQNETNKNEFTNELISEIGIALLAWGKVMRLIEQSLCIVFTDKFSSPIAMKILVSTLSEKQKMRIFYNIIKKSNRAVFCNWEAENNFRELKDKLHYASQARNFIMHRFLTISQSPNTHAKFIAANKYPDSEILAVLKENRQIIEDAAALLADFITRAENAKNPAAAMQDSLFGNPPPK